MSENPQTATIEVNDAIFCEQHKLEVCTDCSYDGREENDTFFGYDSKDRDPLELPPYIVTKEGKVQCKKHANAGCAQCMGWKKQIQRLRVKAKKEGR